MSFLKSGARLLRRSFGNEDDNCAPVLDGIAISTDPIDRFDQVKMEITDCAIREDCYGESDRRQRWTERWEYMVHVKAQVDWRRSSQSETISSTVSEPAPATGSLLSQVEGNTRADDGDEQPGPLNQGDQAGQSIFPIFKKIQISLFRKRRGSDPTFDRPPTRRQRRALRKARRGKRAEKPPTPPSPFRSVLNMVKTFGGQTSRRSSSELDPLAVPDSATATPATKSRRTSTSSLERPSWKSVGKQTYHEDGYFGKLHETDNPPKYKPSEKGEEGPSDWWCREEYIESQTASAQESKGANGDVESAGLGLNRPKVQCSLYEQQGGQASAMAPRQQPLRIR